MSRRTSKTAGSQTFISNKISCQFLTVLCYSFGELRANSYNLVWLFSCLQPNDLFRGGVRGWSSCFPNSCSFLYNSHRTNSKSYPTQWQFITMPQWQFITILHFAELAANSHYIFIRFAFTSLAVKFMNGPSYFFLKIRRFPAYYIAQNHTKCPPQKIFRFSCHGCISRSQWGNSGIGNEEINAMMQTHQIKKDNK